MRTPARNDSEAKTCASDIADGFLDRMGSYGLYDAVLHVPLSAISLYCFVVALRVSTEKIHPAPDATGGNLGSGPASPPAASSKERC